MRLALFNLDRLSFSILLCYFYYSLTVLSGAPLNSFPFQLSSNRVGPYDVSALEVKKYLNSWRALLNKEWFWSKSFISHLQSDISSVRIQEDVDKSLELLQELKSFDIAYLPVEERLNYELIVKKLEDKLHSAPFKEWVMPMTHLSGIHLRLQQLPNMLSFNNVSDYKAYQSRLIQIPESINTTIDLMREGIADSSHENSLVVPKVVIEKVIAQIERITELSLFPEKTPFAKPLVQFSSGISGVEKVRIKRDVLGIIREKVIPAYAELSRFLKQEYLLVGRGENEIGLWALPDGDARYRHKIYMSTTLRLDPEVIHQQGLDEVERISELLKKANAQEMCEEEKLASLKTIYVTNAPKNILDRYHHYIDEMSKRLPNYFLTIPKEKIVIHSLPKEYASDVPTQYENLSNGTTSISQILVNTSAQDPMSSISRLDECTAYHEGVPGHHLQTSISRQLKLPLFRKHSAYPAFDEGWAFYSEGLAYEMGFYVEKKNRYCGMLESDLLRSARLVIDTGIHATHLCHSPKKWPWNRRDAISYLQLLLPSFPLSQIEAEVDRAIADPGSLLAYKIGQLKILELRREMQKKLGSRFDIKIFHELVLGAGSIPLDVLERRVRAYTDGH